MKTIRKMEEMYSEGNYSRVILMNYLEQAEIEIFDLGERSCR